MRLVQLGIDIGGTGSRWVACDAAAVEQARGRAEGATGHIFNPAERQRLAAVLATMAGELAQHGLQPTRLSIGLTGYGDAVRDDMALLLSETFGIAPSALDIMDDMALAYRALYAPGEGHLVSAGTGSIGIHMGAAETIRVGGRGILIDDGGSGSWIAITALDRIYRAHDLTGSFDAVAALADALFAQIGGRDWDHTRGYVYAGDRGRIGALATAVAAAANEGDATALAILTQAGRELARLAEALAARAGTLPVAFIGGVLRLHPTIRAEIEAALPGQDLRFPEIDPALAAARVSP